MCCKLAFDDTVFCPLWAAGILICFSSLPTVLELPNYEHSSPEKVYWNYSIIYFYWWILRFFYFKITFWASFFPLLWGLLLFKGLALYFPNSTYSCTIFEFCHIRCTVCTSICLIFLLNDFKSIHPPFLNWGTVYV